MPTKMLYATLIWITEVHRQQPREDDQDRGDVPGWVMITVMTAIVVIALLAVFRTQVENAVTSAFSKVNNSGN